MFKVTTQFSIFLVNKPGILSRVCDELAAKKINIVAMTLMDSVEHGVLRVVVKDVEKARKVLRALNIPLAETEVLAADMPNRPGAMGSICARLNSQHVSIRYAYVTSGTAGGRTIGIFKVDNAKKALKVTGPRTTGRKERKVSRLAPRARTR